MNPAQHAMKHDPVCARVCACVWGGGHVIFLIHDLLAISTAWKSLQFILLPPWRFIRTNTGFLDMCMCVKVCVHACVFMSTLECECAQVTFYQDKFPPGDWDHYFLKAGKTPKSFQNDGCAISRLTDGYKETQKKKNGMMSFTTFTDWQTG